MGKELRFPKDFLWGAAVAAYQVEGGIENSDWSRDFPAGRACDHYNQYEKDFDLMQELNFNAFRFSIEWSRIEPEPGRFNEKEIEHYKRYLKSLKDRNIKIIMTLHHFTSPAWLAKIGGWASKKSVSYFSCFANKIFNEYKDLVDFWITINEPLNYSSIGYLEGRWPPKKRNVYLFLKVFKNQISAHKKLYQDFHTIKPDVKVGIAKINNFFEPFSNSFLDKLSVRLAHYFWNELFLNRIRNNLDFIGLNYYFHDKIRFSFSDMRCPVDIACPVSDLGWEIYAPGIYYVLKDLKKYNLPIYITENGVADKQDVLRKDFIKHHLAWIWQAIEEGTDVRGYFHWSLMDNFEWEKGFDPRFGLIEIDYQTQKRKPRPSAFYYAKICENNTLLI